MTSSDAFDDLRYSAAARGGKDWHWSDWFDLIRGDFKCVNCNNGLGSHSFYPYRANHTGTDYAPDYGACVAPSGTWALTLFRVKPQQAATLAKLLKMYLATPAGQEHLGAGLHAKNESNNTSRDLLYALITQPAKYGIPLGDVGVCNDYD